MSKNEKKSKAAAESVLSKPEREGSVDANNFVQRVEKKAYEFYMQRSCEHGCDWGDWFEAEKAVEREINTVDKDCIRSESFYKSSHRSISFPSGVDVQKIDTNSFAKRF